MAPPRPRTSASTSPPGGLGRTEDRGPGTHLAGATFLSDLPLDAILADDNAVFATALGGRLLSQLNMQTAAGSLLGVVLCRFAPLGRLPSRARLLPLTSLRLAPFQLASCPNGFL